MSLPYKPYETESDWPEKAYKNLTFLNSHDARKIRVLCELQEPETRLSELGVEDTIIFFGSARIPDTATAQANLDRARKDAQAAGQEDVAARARLRIAEQQARCAPYHDVVRDLARRMTEWSMKIPEGGKRFIVCSGGGPGMMEAANHGAQMAGGDSMGLGISLPFEQSLNPYVSKELSYEFHYFFVRKYWFLYHAKAMVVAPGGFGTMDELFEVVTLIQTAKIEKHLPIVLIGREFWESILNFPAFLEWGVISEQDLDLFKIMDTAEEASDYLISDLTEHYLNR